jgi:hypothetical protein
VRARLVASPFLRYVASRAIASLVHPTIQTLQRRERLVHSLECSLSKRRERSEHTQGHRVADALLVVAVHDVVLS